MTQRGVFFLFSSPCFKGIKYRGHNIFWPCCNYGFPPAIAHMIMELCNNIRGVWENLWPIKSLKQCSNLWVRAAVGDIGHKMNFLELCRMHASVPSGTVQTCACIHGGGGRVGQGTCQEPQLFGFQYHE